MGISDDGVRLTLRLPEKLRTKLGQQAIKNHRSLNSEIVSQLSGPLPYKEHYLKEARPLYTVSNKTFEAACKKLSSTQKGAILGLIDLLGKE